MRRVAATSPAAPGVLMVSKPVAPPWNDSGKKLAHDLAAHCPEINFRLLTTRGTTFPRDNMVAEAIYGAPGHYQPSLLQNARVLLRLLRPDRVPIYHFFFAPNPRSSMIARLALRLKRRRTVHTLCSRPLSFDEVADLMFAERVVALSAHTRAALQAAGVSGVVHIPPGIPEAPPTSEATRQARREQLGLGNRPVVLYAGDYEFSGAARAVAEAAARVLNKHDARFIFACRNKQETSRNIKRHIQTELRAAGVAERVLFLDECDDMPSLLGLADLHVQPAGCLYAKMDLPLVLLESLREGVPLVLANVPPLSELLEDDIGRGIPPEDGEALAATIESLLAAPEERHRMSANCRAVAGRRYGARRMARDYAALYEDLLREQP